SYIKNFPIDKLKIDRSFISGTHANQQQMSIVQAIIQLAHALKMHVVAEGIETQEQAFKLKHMNCDEAQGFWYNKPLPKDKATELVINFIAQENEQTTD
ncbi:MAG: EAL domain-containing protein, partial [Gammaproteobacteria bacterium]|nr:EAL domain-containing protein [Gammaproteobacteria bacterium]